MADLFDRHMGKRRKTWSEERDVRIQGPQPFHAGPESRYQRSWRTFRNFTDAPRPGTVEHMLQGFEQMTTPEVIERVQLMRDIAAEASDAFAPPPQEDNPSFDRIHEKIAAGEDYLRQLGVEVPGARTVVRDGEPVGSGPKKRKNGEERKEEDEVLQEEKDGSEPRAGPMYSDEDVGRIMDAREFLRRTVGRDYVNRNPRAFAAGPRRVPTINNEPPFYFGIGFNAFADQSLRRLPDNELFNHLQDEQIRLQIQLLADDQDSPERMTAIERAQDAIQRLEEEADIRHFLSQEEYRRRLGIDPPLEID